MTNATEHQVFSKMFLWKHCLSILTLWRFICESSSCFSCCNCCSYHSFTLLISSLHTNNQITADITCLSNAYRNFHFNTRSFEEVLKVTKNFQKLVKNEKLPPGFSCVYWAFWFLFILGEITFFNRKNVKMTIFSHKWIHSDKIHSFILLKAFSSVCVDYANDNFSN